MKAITTNLLFNGSWHLLILPYLFKIFTNSIKRAFLNYELKIKCFPWGVFTLVIKSPGIFFNIYARFPWFFIHENPLLFCFYTSVFWLEIKISKFYFSKKILPESHSSMLIIFAIYLLENKTALIIYFNSYILLLIFIIFLILMGIIKK